ncbi:Ger(X)C family germination protein [Paenisporosarcina sp. HGH0030]|uniref:Ger(x)C family spore germination protein n=1 Tax=Paenisporosarcina sp. HGH0030 TaxID=1078085 RepID=UPI00034E78E9|nr:Ger(x)C family spore germination protein [Paenisporosarcina sp. HGH0030]EPD52081.1 Ger(X)C family germination protein [Paenisporosarcina sp. HGH0030]
MRNRLLLILIIINIFLAGCWDQHQLVNKTLVNGISFDLTEEGKIHATVRALNIKSKGGGQFEIEDELVSAERPTLAGLGIDINSMTAGQVDFSQAHIILIGDELAQNGILQLLDPFYRGKDSNIVAKIAITKGKAEDIISSEKEKSPIAFFILQTIEEAEESTLLPEETIFTVWTNILTTGKDFILPYLEKGESDKIAIAGVALFNGDKFSGKTLSKEQSSLLLLLLDQLKKTNNMELMLIQASEEDRSIAFSTRKMKRNMEIKVDKTSGDITCNIDISIQIEVNTYPQNLTKDLNIKKLNKEISVELTNQAKEVIAILLQANCDAFGIGMRLANTHPDIWKKMNWDEDYKNVQIEPKVNVSIIKTGAVY